MGEQRYRYYPSRVRRHQTTATKTIARTILLVLGLAMIGTGGMGNIVVPVLAGGSGSSSSSSSSFTTKTMQSVVPVFSDCIPDTIIGAPMPSRPRKRPYGWRILLPWQRSRSRTERPRPHSQQQQQSKRGRGLRRRCRGSLITRGIPPPEQLSLWFWDDLQPGGTVPHFNHDLVGMTNPCYHVASPSSKSCSSSSSSSTATVMIATGSKPSSSSRSTITGSPCATTNNRRTPSTIHKRIATETTTPPDSSRIVVTAGHPSHHHPRDDDDDDTNRSKNCGGGGGDHDDEDGFHWPETASRIPEWGNRQRRHRQSKRQHPSSSSGQWHVMEMTRCMGYGMDCYQRVRDAALQWEFHTPEGRAMWPIRPVSETCRRDSIPDSPQPTTRRHQHHRKQSQHHQHCATNTQPWSHITSNSELVQQCWMGPARRFVTCTRIPFLSSFFPFPSLLPPDTTTTTAAAAATTTTTATTAKSPNTSSRLYIINPVHIIYDLIDQRGAGMTYTSTAYATGARHWLQGEERVTVSIRDRDGAVAVQILSVARPAARILQSKRDGRRRQQQQSLVPHRIREQWIWEGIIQPMQRSFFRQQLDALERVAQQQQQQPRQSSSSSSSVLL